MLVRCPYKDCLATFETPESRSGRCHGCCRLISYRPSAVFDEVEKQSEWRKVPRFNPLMFQEKRWGSDALFAIVEDVRSLWNVGSIFRSADGAGMAHIFLCGITGTPPRKEIAKTSLGAEDTTPWSFSLSALEPIDAMKQAGVKVIALECTKDLEGIADSEPLKTMVEREQFRSSPLCFIVGNEVTGVSMETLTACDAIGHLPMRGRKESLNVAVAFGIGAYMLASRYNELEPRFLAAEVTGNGG